VEVPSTLAIDQFLLLWGKCEEARKRQPACAAAWELSLTSTRASVNCKRQFETIFQWCYYQLFSTSRSVSVPLRSSLFDPSRLLPRCLPLQCRVSHSEVTPCNPYLAYLSMIYYTHESIGEMQLRCGSPSCFQQTFSKEFRLACHGDRLERRNSLLYLTF
jgi:hypothetical protein